MSNIFNISLFKIVERYFQLAYRTIIYLSNICLLTMVDCEMYLIIMGCKYVKPHHL